MKAIALIGSPRRGGNTDLLCDAFLEGCQQAGAEIQKIYLDDMDIRPIAEVGDDWKTRVDLRGFDDWRRVMEQVLQSDILALGSPVYWQGVTAQMKCFIDRWSCYYASEWLADGFRGMSWAVLCPYGHPTQDESHWVTDPAKLWAKRWRGQYIGDVCVSAAKKGAVAEMPEVMGAARKLGKKAVEAAVESPD